MTEILFVNGCVRENSRTLELAQCLLEQLEGNVEQLDIFRMQIPPLDLDGMQLRGQAAQTQDFSGSAFALANQFAQAKTIVIAAPYWDLMFPAQLKSYLENVSVAGITFEYSQQGIPVGLCKATRLYYVTTAGGFIGSNDFGFAYIKALASGLFGIKDVQGFSAEGLDITPELCAAAMEKAKKNIVIA